MLFVKNATMPHYHRSDLLYRTMGCEVPLVFGMSTKRKPEVRVFLDEDQSTLVKALAALKKTSASELFNQALDLWLAQPEQQQLIEKHNLDKIDGE